MKMMHTRMKLAGLALVCVPVLFQPFAINAQETGRVARQDGGSGRIRPPEAVTCNRNNLTAYTGKVVSYSRRSTRLTMTIDTDDDTTETVTLSYKRNTNPARWFLFRGARFKTSDWARVEASRGSLLPLMRATAWVCNDGRPPIIDWRPHTGEGPAPPATP